MKLKELFYSYGADIEKQFLWPGEGVEWPSDEKIGPTWKMSLLQHALWMCSQSFDCPDKLNRWLGFVQAIMWISGLRTIRQLRDETREALK